MDNIFIITLIVIVIYRIGYKIGFNRGVKRNNVKIEKRGYLRGKRQIENEIFKLSKEGDGEIVRRIKKFAESYSYPHE